MYLRQWLPPRPLSPIQRGAIERSFKKSYQLNHLPLSPADIKRRENQSITRFQSMPCLNCRSTITFIAFIITTAAQTGFNKTHVMKSRSENYLKKKKNDTPKQRQSMFPLRKKKKKEKRQKEKVKEQEKKRKKISTGPFPSLQRS